MQNSLGRIFEGIGSSLREVVQPALEDPYARSQVDSTIELLANLSTRVEWRCEHLAALVARVRDVLEEVDARAPEDVEELAPVRMLLAEEPPPRHDNQALVEARTEHLAALAAVQTWLADAAPQDGSSEELQAAVEDLVGWHLDRELDRLRR